MNTREVVPAAKSKKNICEPGHIKRCTCLITEWDQSTFRSIHVHILATRHMRGSRGGGGGIVTPPPPPLRNHKNIGFLSNTGPDSPKFSKFSKLPSQHSMLGWFDDYCFKRLRSIINAPTPIAYMYLIREDFGEPAIPRRLTRAFPHRIENKVSDQSLDLLTLYKAVYVHVRIGNGFMHMIRTIISRAGPSELLILRKPW